jgi:alcohol dehydrogenase
MQASRYDAMLNMIEKGRLTPSELIARTVPLEETGAVMASMDDYETLGFCVIDRY